MINFRARHFFYINLEQIKRTTCPIKFTPFSYERKNTVGIEIEECSGCNRNLELMGMYGEGY
jgi:hypothetical protein